MLRGGERLGLPHFAFLRSCLLGLDPRQAWERYLSASEGNIGRGVEHRRDALWRQVLGAGRALPATQPLSEALAVLSRARRSGAATATLPTLDEFVEVEGLDHEFHSESELLQQYRDHHHLDGAAAPAPRDAADASVRALHTVESLLSRQLAGGDSVEAWFTPTIAALLRRAGFGTLAALVQAINTRGYRWYRQVPRLGETRARAIAEWLAAAGEDLAPPVDAAARRRPAPQPALIRRPGSPGRAPADDDERQAVSAWLARHASQPATLRTYAKEIERFRLWARQTRGKGLLAVVAADCDAYRRFLAALPPDWICRRPVAQSDPAWRPFRGTLAPASQRLALAAVRSFFGSLVPSSHNPVSSVPSPRVSGRRPLDWDRLVEAAHLRRDQSARGRRLLLILRLAQSGVPAARMVEQAPSLCPLRDAPPAWFPAPGGALTLHRRCAVGSLSAGAIRRVIARFRTRCAEAAENIQDEVDGFAAAAELSVKAPGGC